MSRLSKLYQAMETLASEGLELSPEQEAQLRKAEEEIIQKVTNAHAKKLKNMKRFSFFTFLIAMVLSTISLTSCSSSANLVLSNGVNLSNYKYVSFGKDQTGDRSLDDIMMLVQNEIANTKLQPISISYVPDDYLGHTLSPNIHIASEKWNGGHTYITITFYDLLTEQSVAVIKSSGIGISIAQDQKLALGAIRKKLQSVFGKKE